jgi:hypothetical protein
MIKVYKSSNNRFCIGAFGFDIANGFFDRKFVAITTLQA